MNDAPEKHRRLELERVHIMAHDNDTRILKYQSLDTSINVTHIIPYGSIPYTLHKNSRRVSFLKAHAVTVSDREGYHNYHIDLKYKFKDVVSIPSESDPTPFISLSTGEISAGSTYRDVLLTHVSRLLVHASERELTPKYHRTPADSSSRPSASAISARPSTPSRSSRPAPS